MIADYIAILEADATLLGLMDGSSVDTKIFPLLADKGTTSPWLTYGMSSQGSSDDVLDEAVVSISVYAETYAAAILVMNRVIVLLDIYEGAGSFASTDFQFLCSKLVPGGSDTREEVGNRLFHLARIFHVKYKRKSGG